MGRRMVVPGFLPAALVAAVLGAGIAAPSRAQTIETARKAIEAEDWATARAELDGLVQSRNAAAMVALGRLHLRAGGAGPIAENPATACTLFERASALGHAEGMAALADCFAEGRGRPQDFGEARRLYQGAGDRGVARAWCAIGRQYFRGQGTEVDGSRGLALCRQGSAMGDGEADAEVGLRYLRGDGLTQSIVDARPWLERAAQRGQAAAARELGEVYWQGRGVPRDRALAVRHFEQAAKAGDLQAAMRYANHRRDVALSGATPVDRRGTVDAMYWYLVLSKVHPDIRVRNQAGGELESLNVQFPDLASDLQHRIETTPYLGKLLK